MRIEAFPLSLYGYARVCTPDQDLGLQEAASVLREHVYGYEVEPLQRRVSGYDRYSERV